MKSINLMRIVLLVTAGAIGQAQDFQTEASKLLKDVQSATIPLTRDAAILDSYARGGISWHSHSLRTTQVREQVNTIGKSLERLQEIREMAAPWQAEAIDAIVPVAAKLAEHTEAAIKHLNERRRVLWVPEYTSQLRAIAERSDEVKELVDLHLDIAATQDKLDRLQERAVTIGS